MAKKIQIQDTHSPTKQEVRQLKVDNYKSKKDFSKMRNDTFNTGLSIFSIIFFVLIVVVLFRNITGSQSNVSFTSFLDYLCNGEISSVENIFNLQTITPLSEWDILDGLRVFLNFFIDLANILIFLAGCLLNAFQYIFYLVRYLFI